jgi:hypothetical protein
MGQQLALYQELPTTAPGPLSRETSLPRVRLCAGCRAKEARYGFRDESEEVVLDRPRTLCFECFRAEIGRRQAVAARLARGWNAKQANLPLSTVLERLERRRRRAQIAARHALGL